MLTVIEVNGWVKFKTPQACVESPLVHIVDLQSDGQFLRSRWAESLEPETPDIRRWLDSSEDVLK